MRKNRLKKRVKQKQQRMVGRLRTGAKLLSLVAVMICVSAVFVLAYEAVTQTNYFKIKSIEIQGESRLSENEVINQAGIKQGDNVMAVNLTLVRKRLLAHPWIVSAMVAREIPGTIKINISEHRALAVVDMGRKFVINEQGRIFKEHNKKDPQGLPVVVGVAYDDISLGEDGLTEVMQTVIEVLNLSKAKHSIVPYSQIRRIYVDAEMGVTLSVWKNERRIKLGHSRFGYKYKQLRRLLPHLKDNHMWRGYQSIDLSNPDRIVVQL